MAFRQGDRAIFVFGFAKNERANVSKDELKALKLLVEELLSYPVMSLDLAVRSGELVEIEVTDDG